MEIFKPTVEDWVKVQGGKPEVSVQGQITTVIHSYDRGEGMVVRGHNVEDMGSVRKLIEGRIVEFPTFMLRAFHGLPCEKRSLRAGGSRYSRI